MATNRLLDRRGVGSLDARMLRRLQRHSFDYFLNEANPLNGLVRDKTAAGWPASIAAVGMALTAYPVGVERKFIERSDAVERTLTTLRYFAASEQSDGPGASGYNGFYYHFLHMETGRREWQCELSSVDTALLIAGALAAVHYFGGPDEDEAEIRRLAHFLYERIDWAWMLNGRDTLCHGWTPEKGFYLTTGKATTKRSFSICWPWAHPHIRFGPSAIRHGAVPTSGKKSTVPNTYMPDRFSFIRCRTSGATCVGFATVSCANTIAITSRTAAAQR